MKTQIEIKIEDKGAATGTLGWFKKLMENSELVIRKNANGTPGMYLKTVDDKGDVKYRFLCRKWDGFSDPFGYITSDNYLCEIPQGRNGVVGLFNVPLTPACKKAVEEFIQSAKEAFAEWWENDGNEDIIK